MIEGGTGPFPPAPADLHDHFQRGGYGHIGFAVEDVDGTVAALSARGVGRLVPATSFPNGAERRVAFFLDPEGNVIEISHPLAKGADESCRAADWSCELPKDVYVESSETVVQLGPVGQKAR